MLYIENANAQASSQAAAPNMMFQFALFAGLFGLMYFMIIRPQRKRQKEHNDLVSALAKGDEVVMTSGMLGKITKLEGEYVVLEVNNNLTLKFQKASVHAVLPIFYVRSSLITIILSEGVQNIFAYITYIQIFKCQININH